MFFKCLCYTALCGLWIWSLHREGTGSRSSLANVDSCISFQEHHLYVKAADLNLRAIAPTVGNHESESKVYVAQSCLTLQPHGLWPARLLCPWNSPATNTGVGSHSFPGHLPDPGIKPASAMSESPGKPALFIHKWINGTSCCSLSNHPRKSSWRLNPEFTSIIRCFHQGC